MIQHYRGYCIEVEGRKIEPENSLLWKVRIRIVSAAGSPVADTEVLRDYRPLTTEAEAVGFGFERAKEIIDAV